MVFVTKKRNDTDKIGGAYDEIKMEEQKDKLKNVTVIKNVDTKNKNMSSEEKLKRFVNFKFK